MQLDFSSFKQLKPEFKILSLIILILPLIITLGLVLALVSQRQLTSSKAENNLELGNLNLETKTPWVQENINPHFKGHDCITGELTKIIGDPKNVKLKDNKLIIDFIDSATNECIEVNPLAIKSKQLGEHPIDKIFRLKEELGIDIPAELEVDLRDPSKKDSFVFQAEFQYLANNSKKIKRTILKIYPDEVFLTDINPIPKEWEKDDRYLVPKFFIVSPDVIKKIASMGDFFSDSSTGNELKSIENEVFSLEDSISSQVFDIDKPILSNSPEEERRIASLRERYLLAYKSYYDQLQKSLSASSSYSEMLRQIGFSFDNDHYQGNLVQRIEKLNEDRSGVFLHSGFWLIDKIKQFGIHLPEDCYSLGNFNIIDDEIFFTLFQKGGVNSFYKLSFDGVLSKLFDSPGRILFSLINHKDKNKLLISSEGYSDERFQSLFEVDLLTKNWRVIDFPGESRGGKPELYVGGWNYTPDGNIILNRYGFPEENGGLWWVNLNNYEKKYLISWDHLLSWLDTQSTVIKKFPLLGNGFTPSIMAITGKEVKDNFSMTINQALLSWLGNQPEISEVSRLGKMVGWNPSVFDYKRNNNGTYLLYAAINYNYENCVESMPKAISSVETTLFVVPTPTPTPTPTPISCQIENLRCACHPSRVWSTLNWNISNGINSDNRIVVKKENEIVKEFPWGSQAKYISYPKNCTNYTVYCENQQGQILSSQDYYCNCWGDCD